MGNPKAFLNLPRKEAGYRPVSERIQDFSEVEQTLNSGDRRLQASRCMDCGVPFCHWACPLGNKVPEWQDLLYKGKWKDAFYLLEQTNDFPEFTGRVCPALCEKSCVLNLSQTEAVTIRENELAIIEAAFREDYLQPRQYKRNGKTVAIVGSGPAGLTLANRLNRKGFSVTVYEKESLIGGLLRYGIPNFKLSKSILNRRLDVMRQEGVVFCPNTQVGKDMAVETLLSQCDALCLAIGAERPRDLPVEGRQLNGVHFAMDLLAQQNNIIQGIAPEADTQIRLKDKHVLVIGGGDTGSDCVGTARRQGAASVTQIEILPQPPAGSNPETPWPMYPLILKTTSSHEEGCLRRWNLSTTRFLGKEGQLEAVEVEEVSWMPGINGSRPQMKVSGKKELIRADVALLAMGFAGVCTEGLSEELGLESTKANTISVDNVFRTSHPKVFACGDAATGASLVVRAMATAVSLAETIDKAFKNNKL